MNTTKCFVGSLGQYMRKAARPSNSVDSLNPCCWRGKQLHHHGGDVSCVFVLCGMVSSGWHNSSYVEKYHSITLRYAYCLTMHFTFLPTHVCTMPCGSIVSREAMSVLGGSAEITPVKSALQAVYSKIQGGRDHVYSYMHDHGPYLILDGNLTI
jgi:hypothetical protein